MPELNLEVVDAPLLALATPETYDVTTDAARNHVRDPRCTAAYEWSVYRGSGVIAGTGPTAVTTDPDEPLCAQMSATTAASGGNDSRTMGLLSEAWPFQQMPVTLGQSVHARIRGKLVSGNGDLRGYVFWRDAASNYLGAAGATAVAGDDNDWHDFTITGTAPANAAYADVAMYLTGDNFSTTYTIRATKALIATSDPGEFFDGDSGEHFSWSDTPHQSQSDRETFDTPTTRDLLTLTTADDAPLALTATESPLLNLTLEAEPE